MTKKQEYIETNDPILQKTDSQEQLEINIFRFCKNLPNSLKQQKINTPEANSVQELMENYLCFIKMYENDLHKVINGFPASPLKSVEIQYNILSSADAIAPLIQKIQESRSENL